MIWTAHKRSIVGAAIAVLAVSTALTACQDGPGNSAGAGPSATTPSVAPVAAIAIDPTDGKKTVRLDSPILVSSSGGTLTSVTLRPDAGGTPVTGKMDEDSTTWTAGAALEPSTAYVVEAEARTPDGRSTKSRSSFTTLKPKQTATASIVPGDGWTVGVGMPVIVDFSRPVKDKAAAEKAVSVTSSPKVTGDWRWMSSRQAQWRPEKYWKSGTKVSVKTRLSGVELSPGVWGKGSKSVDFTIGSAMISSVDMRRHTLTVSRNGKVIRTIPITTGKSGYATRSGVKVIMSRETSRRMDAETTGISRNSSEYYNINVKYAMRLTHSGEFLHAAPWSVGSQGRANVSHGCTGMSTTNARWLFSQSKVGDVVSYKGSSRSLEWGNGYTAWEMSFDRWSEDA